MNADPRVSVIIPTFNGAAYLGAAIDSVLAQRFPDFELLVLDNASTDETPALVSRYADPRLVYRRHAANLGLAGNLEYGWSLARGPLVTVLGADDLWHPRFLEAAVVMLEGDAGLAMVHGPATWIDEQGRPFGGTGEAWPERTPGALAMCDAFGAGFCFSTMVMRRGVISGPFDTHWQEIIDLWLFLRMCLAGDVGYLPEVLCDYRVHAQAMSMPMYRENLMFRRQLAAAHEAFAWPQAQAIGAGGFEPAARRSAARIAMEVLHMAREEGLSRYLGNFAEVVREVPAVLAEPHSWARFGFGLLPLSLIRHLQELRRRRALAGASEQPARALP